MFSTNRIKNNYTKEFKLVKIIFIYFNNENTYWSLAGPIHFSYELVTKRVQLVRIGRGKALDIDTFNNLTNATAFFSIPWTVNCSQGLYPKPCLMTEKDWAVFFAQRRCAPWFDDNRRDGKQCEGRKKSLVSP